MRSEDEIAEEFAAVCLVFQTASRATIGTQKDGGSSWQSNNSQLLESPELIFPGKK